MSFVLKAIREVALAISLVLGMMALLSVILIGMFLALSVGYWVLSLFGLVQGLGQKDLEFLAQAVIGEIGSIVAAILLTIISVGIQDPSELRRGFWFKKY